jgi:hypothetical protein
LNWSARATSIQSDIKVSSIPPVVPKLQDQGVALIKDLYLFSAL